MIEKRTTKDLLAESLKELCKIKSADKITIKELTQNCGLTAPTFYNHFRGKYELMAWIYNQKVEASLKNFGRGDSFEDVICKWMDIVLEDEEFYRHLLKNAVGQNSFRYATNDHAINLIADWITGGLGVCQRLVLVQVGLFAARDGKIFHCGNARAAQAAPFINMQFDKAAL